MLAAVRFLTPEGKYDKNYTVYHYQGCPKGCISGDLLWVKGIKNPEPQKAVFEFYSNPDAVKISSGRVISAIKYLDQNQEEPEMKNEIMQSTINKVKEAIIAHQIGSAVIATVKKAILAVPSVPDKVKEIIQIPGYGDAIVGILIGVALEIYGVGGKAQKVAQYTKQTGALELSRQFTFVKDIVEGCMNIKAVRGLKEE